MGHVETNAVCLRGNLYLKIGPEMGKKKGAMIPIIGIIAFQLKEAGVGKFIGLSELIKWGKPL